MEKIINSYVNHKKIVVAVFLIAGIIFGLMALMVKVNYQLSDYLPQNSPSTQALNVMNEEFDSSIGNGQVMLYGESLAQAEKIKDQLLKVPQVTNITWLGDVADITLPPALLEEQIRAQYYKDNKPRLFLTIKEGEEVQAMEEIYDILGDEGAVTGEAVVAAKQQEKATDESLKAMLVLVPIVIIILLLTTTSWIEPLLFLLTIGLSVLFNWGTNFFSGEISFITQAASPILQFAVSLDYAIFLLHSFDRYRKTENSNEEAMKRAVKKSFPVIFASASTTLLGFAALVLMKFQIGADLGINLVKGIAFSFISVAIFLPCLTLLVYKYVEKTRHKTIIPRTNYMGKRILKFRYLILVLVILIIVPSFLGQSKNDFLYGSGENISKESRAGRDMEEINQVYGKSTPIVILVPRGEMGKETALVDKLKSMDKVNGVLSYVSTIGGAVPLEMVDPQVLEQFYSENYGRIIVSAGTETEGKEAFALVEDIRSAVNEVYPRDTWMLGESVNLYDIKRVVEKDTPFVTGMAILAIGLVLLLSFRSLTLPIILLLTIEASIWINLAVPYFTQTPLNYIGYLVISTVQLGATVDYAILLTHNYLGYRKAMDKIKAMRETLGHVSLSIMVSATMLSAAGFCLGIISTDPIISELGMLLGRGTILSVAMVMVFLPALLILLDKIIFKTTKGAQFYQGGCHEERK